MSEPNKPSPSQKARPFIAAFIILLLLLFASLLATRHIYNQNLLPISNNNDPVVVTIEPGSTPGEIANALKSKQVIKSDWAFEWYVRNQNLRGSLKAGTYIFSQSQSVPEIAEKMALGKIATDLVTILPGKRLDQIRDGLIKSGFALNEVDEALDPKNYQGHPALSDKPDGASLEGYLYPESFQKTADTSPKRIIRLSLDEMADYLSEEVRKGFAEQNLSVHQGIILASIVEQEVSKKTDKPVVAQVFLKRLKIGMNLGADPTALYGAVVDGKEPSLYYDSPYNTRMHAGLPPGPIGNTSQDSLKAVASPAKTDWLFFVAGDDGITRFSKTLQEHEALTKEHCRQLCRSY